MAIVSSSNKNTDQIAGAVEILAMFSTVKSGSNANTDIEKALGKSYKSDLKKLQFTGELEQSILVSGPKRPIMVLGLGKEKDLTFEKLRTASANIIKQLKKYPTAIAGYGNAASQTLDPNRVATAMVEGLGLGSYSYSVYKDKNKQDLKKIVISGVTKKSTQISINRSIKIVENVVWARDAINTPPNEKAPKDLALRVKKLFANTNVKVEILDEAGIKRNKMAGVQAVGGGSINPPRFVKLSYKSPGAKKNLAFVGKGVIFDSGGLSIKPGDAMTTMKCDMSGAAAVAAAFKAIAALKLKVNVEGYMPMVENMPSGSAYRVDDILTYKNGVTAEIQNTDAEGRLILADALIAASDAKPDAIIDLATLTGACVVALGDQIAAAMSNSDSLRERVLKSAEQAGERLWPLPLPQDYRKLIDTPVADVANAGPRKGGTITAGLFLKEFVGNVDWVHLDIAGPAFLDKPSGENSEGGTGFGVRTLVELAESFA